MRPRIVGLLVITCCLIVESPVFGQESTAEIRGRVIDAQNAAIPGAVITITNQATGVVRQAAEVPVAQLVVRVPPRSDAARLCQVHPA